ncbi:MAG: DNA sulfur modification protein DndD [Amphibacillus sp.]|nr:DNA sulfur modification protein DndD [Amphibacillus sp.]
MLFKTIELTNIGPYEGVNTFSFDTNDIKNTVLIGGKNGSGKTTFLNSVRLALYGPLAYGFRTYTESYLTTIETLLNNKAKNKAHSPYQIKLGISTVDNFERVSIEICRRWTLSKNTIKEHIEIYKGREKLSEVDKDNFLEKLRVTFPPSLLELCFFDGEDITKLSDEDNLSSYLKELSSKLFNLDLFQSLEDNLKRYLTEDSKSTDEIKLEEKREQVENELSNKIAELRHLETENERLKEQLEITKETYKKTRNEFSTHGGLLFDEREIIQREILEIENTRKIANEKIKDFIAKELPFFLGLPILNSLVDQLNNEEDYYISNIIGEKVNNISFEKITETLGNSFNLKQKEAEKLRDLLREELTNHNSVDILHNASKTETNQIHTLAGAVNYKRLESINKLINESNNDLNRLSILNKKLRDNIQTSEFSDMIEAMEIDSQKISEIETKLQKLMESKEELSIEIDQINKQYEKIKKDLYTIYKKKSSFDVTEKALMISQKFQKEQLRRKVADIEYFSSKMIKKLMRKENFIDQIHIDHESFEVSLTDEENKIINKTILSAGENELLVLAIIWGTLHSSNKEIPIVLDTLLGRLDLDHKATVINELVPRFGKQCIILATDSEITEDLVEDLAKFVTNYYTLNYDTKKKQTNIEKRFFNNAIEGEPIHEL